jgi:predicted N-acetyltransferase YhbS
MTIRPLGQQDEQAIEALLDAAFGTDRHTRTAYAIRNGMRWLPDLSHALLNDDGVMIGLLQSWPVALDDGETAPAHLVMVGPVAVHPDHQGEGYGRMLMDHMVPLARASGSPPLVMIGDPEYYERFWGFSADATGGWSVPGPVDPKRLLTLALNGEQLPTQGMLGPRVSARA